MGMMVVSILVYALIVFLYLAYLASADSKLNILDIEDLDEYEWKEGDI